MPDGLKSRYRGSQSVCFWPILAFLQFGAPRRLRQRSVLEFGDGGPLPCLPSLHSKVIGLLEIFDCGYLFGILKYPSLAEKLDPNELVPFKELLISNSIQVDALCQLLIEEGLISEQKFFAKLKQVQADYKKRQYYPR
jgi:hypothetical protein